VAKEKLVACGKVGVMGGLGSQDKKTRRAGKRSKSRKKRACPRPPGGVQKKGGGVRARKTEGSFSKANRKLMTIAGVKVVRFKGKSPQKGNRVAGPKQKPFSTRNERSA